MLLVEYERKKAVEGGKIGARGPAISGLSPEKGKS
jgi:hypothetical protein